MRPEELESTLRDISKVFAAAGTPQAAKDFQELATFIGHHKDRELYQLLAEIRDKLDPSSQRILLIAKHVGQLREAGLDEAKFRTALEALKTEKTLDKSDVEQILRDYGVIRIAGKSKPALIESLEKHFYWSLYNKDADALAKRATPW